MTAMIMQPLDKNKYDEWDRFVARANGTIFHTAWWYDAWGVDFDIYARYGKDGEIEAGMPIHMGWYGHLPRLLGIKGLTRPPLTLVNGPLFLESKKAGRSDRYSHAKDEAMCAISSLPGADFYDILFHRFQDDLMPYIWSGFDTSVYYTYVIPRGEADSWRENIRGSARYNINKAHKEAEENGYTIETDRPMDEVIPLCFETAKKKGYSNAFVRVAAKMPRWWLTVRGKGAGRSYLLRDGRGRALCAALMVWDKHTAYSLISGMSPGARERGGPGILLWERRIADALAMGLDFDFEGSTLMGVEGFIRRWGGELRPCFRVMKVPSILTYAGIKAYRFMKYHRSGRIMGYEAGQKGEKRAKYRGMKKPPRLEPTAGSPMRYGSRGADAEKYTETEWREEERIPA